MQIDIYVSFLGVDCHSLPNGTYTSTVGLWSRLSAKPHPIRSARQKCWETCTFGDATLKQGGEEREGLLNLSDISLSSPLPCLSRLLNIAMLSKKGAVERGICVASMSHHRKRKNQVNWQWCCNRRIYFFLKIQFFFQSHRMGAVRGAGGGTTFMHSDVTILISLLTPCWNCSEISQKYALMDSAYWRPSSVLT